MAEELQEEKQPEVNELEETKNRLLRALADFDNYKKRIAAEKEQFVQFANEALITDLLPILDGFNRAMEVLQKIKGSEETIKGLALIKRQLEDVLKKYGVVEIEAWGQPFDPHWHEAVLQKEAAEPAGIVLEELQKGYALNKRLLRPAMVIVSKKQ